MKVSLPRRKSYENVHEALNQLPVVPQDIRAFFGDELVERMNKVFRSDVLLESDAYRLSGELEYEAIRQANQAFEDYQETLREVYRLAKDCAEVVRLQLPRLLEEFVALSRGGTHAPRRAANASPVGRRSLKRQPKKKKKKKNTINRRMAQPSPAPAKRGLILSRVLELGDRISNLYAYHGLRSITNSRASDFYTIYTSSILLEIQKLITSGQLPPHVAHSIQNEYFPRLRPFLASNSRAQIFAAADIYRDYQPYKQAAQPLFDHLRIMSRGENLEEMRLENDLRIEQILDKTVYKDVEEKQLRIGPLEISILPIPDIMKSQVACQFKAHIVGERIGPYGVSMGEVQASHSFSFTFLRYRRDLIIGGSTHMPMSSLTGQPPIIEEKLRAILLQALLDDLDGRPNKIEDLLTDIAGQVKEVSDVSEVVEEPVEEVDEEPAEEIADVAENVFDEVEELLDHETDPAKKVKSPSTRKFHAIPFRKIRRGFNAFGVRELTSRSGKHPIYEGPNGIRFPIPARTGGERLGTKILLNALDIWGIDRAEFLKTIKR